MFNKYQFNWNFILKHKLHSSKKLSWLQKLIRNPLLSSLQYLQSNNDDKRFCCSLFYTKRLISPNWPPNSLKFRDWALNFFWITQQHLTRGTQSGIKYKPSHPIYPKGAQTAWNVTFLQTTQHNTHARTHTHTHAYTFLHGFSWAASLKTQ